MRRLGVISLWLLTGGAFVLGIITKSLFSSPFNAIFIQSPKLSVELLVFIAAILLCVYGLVTLVQTPFSSRSESDHRLYGIDHGRLNLELPPPSLWMNMGYWKNTNKFSTACSHLLTQVILKSQIFDAKGTSTRDGGRFVSILDLGFGCGDQSIAIMKVPCKDVDERTTRYKSIFDSYVGITLNWQQFEYAKLRFKYVGLEESEGFKVFCADAANPQSWSNDITDAISSLQPQSKSRLNADTNELLKNEIWVLALDCLYHFKPSRGPIFEYSAKTLNANIMAFDLLLADNISPLNLFLLKAVGRLMDCPPHAFKKRFDYLDQLRIAGYGHVETYDISEHVFAPLAKFLRRQERDLKTIGLGLGKLKVATWLFEWWASNAVVRGVIVVAKHHDP